MRKVAVLSLGLLVCLLYTSAYGEVSILGGGYK